MNDQTQHCVPVQDRRTADPVPNPVVAPASEPLALVISAKHGTRAAAVLKLIETITAGDTRFTCKLGVEEGVFLAPLTGKKAETFSPKFTIRCDGVIEMYVGSNLPESMERRAAEQLLAIIKRGNYWAPNDGRSVLAYGPTIDLEIARARSDRNRRKKQKKQQAAREHRRDTELRSCP